MHFVSTVEFVRCFFLSTWVRKGFLRPLQKFQNLFKYLCNSHGDLEKGKPFDEYFDVKIVKSYRKPLTRCVEEGTFIVNFEGEVLNKKNKKLMAST